MKTLTELANITLTELNELTDAERATYIEQKEFELQAMHNTQKTLTLGTEEFGKCATFISSIKRTILKLNTKGAHEQAFFTN